MQVPYDEGVAINIGPESCAVAREGLGEALTGARIGQPVSRESFLFWVPTPCIWWKATHSGASAWSIRLGTHSNPCDHYGCEGETREI